MKLMGSKLQFHVNDHHFADISNAFLMEMLELQFRFRWNLFPSSTDHYWDVMIIIVALCKCIFTGVKADQNDDL